MTELNDQQPKLSMRDNVLSAIEAGKVSMRPRWQFVLSAVLFGLGVVLIVLASIFIGSFVLFALRQSGAWYAPSFGKLGYGEIFTALPIMVVVAGILFVIILQILVRHYKFSYGKPVLYTLGAVILAVIVGSVIVDQSHLHSSLFGQARQHNLPIGEKFYLQFGEPSASHTTPGIITKVMDGGFIMRDPRSQEFIVIINHQTRLPYGEDFEVGDGVIVLGDRKNNIITATGVREFEPDTHLFERQDFNPDNLPGNHQQYDFIQLDFQRN